jgi:hypothetical protein
MHRFHAQTIHYREEGLSISAYWMGILVGQVQSVQKEDGSVLLGDIIVKKQVEAKSGFLAKTIRRFHPGWGLVFPRRIGIGTELLKRFIQGCEREGVREIYGNVTPDADRDQPFLRGWYEGFGFVVSPPDGRDEWFPVKYKVVRKCLLENSAAPMVAHSSPGGSEKSATECPPDQSGG